MLSKRNGSTFGKSGEGFDKILDLVMGSIPYEGREWFRGEGQECVSDLR